MRLFIRAHILWCSLIPASLKKTGLIHFELIEVKLCKQSHSAVLNCDICVEFFLGFFFTRANAVILSSQYLILCESQWHRIHASDRHRHCVSYRIFEYRVLEYRVVDNRICDIQNLTWIFGIFEYLAEHSDGIRPNMRLNIRPNIWYSEYSVAVRAYFSIITQSVYYMLVGSKVYPSPMQSVWLNAHDNYVDKSFFSVSWTTKT